MVIRDPNRFQGSGNKGFIFDITDDLIGKSPCWTKPLRGGKKIQIGI